MAQDWETIIQELRTAIAEAFAELRPITADEVTDRDIIPAGVELEEVGE